ncbi:RDD family protein [Corynebacterium poyangense]|uniref:RDD family protein n=1 Tax=Corynebacterium poyangense TaxID=2684405 RepID=A0A7H0SPX3_9CORY|nr:RDD family protein [Corynebacterium poyangense]MBZ8178477.1 RDD family protein [Corynebacterium poyangense]QNQ90598.1 RDD family protein [Corynebacterium poyangense]
MANRKRSWIEGPQIPGENEDPHSPGRWPGEKLGLPKTGPGSLASVMRRVGGIFIDQWICWALAFIITRYTDFFGDIATTTWLLFPILGTLTGWLFARTPGQALFGMGIARTDVPGTRVGFLRALARSVFTSFLFPPLIMDSDGRGLHDRATGTSVILG